jgi:hypothetical protein
MNKKYKIIISGLILLVVIVIIAYPIYQKNSMIEATLAWSRMAPFPSEIDEFEIETKGGMFSRSFRASFKAETAIIENWINISEGTKDLEPEEQNGILIYHITPGEGAAFAELKYYKNDNRVELYTYWS